MTNSRYDESIIQAVENRGFSQGVDEAFTLSAYDALLEAYSLCLDGRQIMSTNEWAGKYRVLGEDNDLYERWQPWLAPYLNGICDVMDSTNPSERVVVVGKAVQVGMTEAAINRVMRSIHQSPATVLYFMENRDKMGRFLKSRWDKMFRFSPFRGMAIKRDALSRYYPGGAVHGNGANSPTGLSSSSASLVMGDEVDQYPEDIGGEGDFLTLARGRITIYAKSGKGKIVMFSKFSGKPLPGGNFFSYWSSGDCREYVVPCPHCGEFWVWGIETLGRGDDGCYQECPKCGGKTFDDDVRIDCVNSGRWEATKEKDVADLVSFRVSGFISNFVSWASIYDNYQLARKGESGSLQAFYNNVLGLPYDDLSDERLTPSEVREKMNSRPYKKGEVPEEVILLTFACDVQKYRLEWEIKGWTMDQCSYSIDYGVIPVQVEQVKECVAALMEIIHTRVYDGLRVTMGCIDSRGTPGTRDHVVEICSFFPDASKTLYSGVLGALVPIQGSAASLVDRAPKVIKSKPGDKIRNRRYKGPVWTVNTYLLKLELYRTLMTDYSEGAHGLAYAPVDYPDSYFRGIQAERMIRVVSSHTGGADFRFVLPGKLDNEPLDLHLYNRVATEILDLYGEDRGRLLRIRRASKEARAKTESKETAPPKPSLRKPRRRRSGTSRRRKSI